MSGPQNAVVGDQDSPIALPETQVPKTVLDEELQMASYAQHPEYKRLREFLEGRAEFFRRHLPDGKRVQDVSKEERDQYWVASCVIVGEIEGILAAYKQVHQAVANAGKNND